MECNVSCTELLLLTKKNGSYAYVLHMHCTLTALTVTDSGEQFSIKV